MKCYVCTTELEWQIDEDLETNEINEEDYVYHESGVDEEHNIVSHLICPNPNCGAQHQVYWTGEYTSEYIN